MSSFLNPHNNTSLTGLTDLTAHSISLYDEAYQKILRMFIPRSD